jgi:HlyD family secretion protein
MKKSKIRWLVLALLFIGGASAVIYTVMERKPPTKTELRLYGNVDIREVQLAFHDTGRIIKLLAVEGDFVKAGQLVAEMDPIRYEAAVARAKAQVATQEQVLARLLAGSRPQEIAAARARRNQAEANLRDAASTFDRIYAIYKKDPGATSRQQFDNAQAALKSAQGKVDEAQQALDLAVLGPRVEDIAAARATLEMYRASLKLAERELADTKLYASLPGVIQDRILEPGDMAFPQSPVYSLALTNPVWVRAYVEEPDLGKVVLGMKAQITTDSFPGKVYEGWVGFISPTAEFTPKQVETTELRSRLVYRVRIYACNPSNELRLGMPVTVTIPLNQPVKNPANINPESCTGS